VPTKDPAAGLRGVAGVDDIGDALDKLGDRDGPYGDEGSDGDALWRGQGREREVSSEQQTITQLITRFLLLALANTLTLAASSSPPFPLYFQWE